ncbi:hypothetical protein Ddye_026983 [Dipteronia dyeriana]|uniref:Uncharacterized protein n=1 Tax=Dipteronia dyeriana TaxID=168575 RepID=A0AAD9TP13_9ROSI|nr:hypothetical protein Ddye_026983 [Dipteronia dyeriana]
MESFEFLSDPVLVEELLLFAAQLLLFFKDRHSLEKEWGQFFSDDLFSLEVKVFFEYIVMYLCGLLSPVLKLALSPKTLNFNFLPIWIARLFSFHEMPVWLLTALLNLAHGL